MSIIYDALQKTQRNREYIRIQNTLLPKKPHRRHFKWMVLGSLLVVLGAGVGAVFSFYTLARPTHPVARAAVKSATPAVLEGAHLWVTNLNRETKKRVETSPPVTVASRLTEVSEQRATPVADPVLASLPLTTRTPASLAKDLPALIPPQPQSVPLAAPAPAPNILVGGNLTLNGVLISEVDKMALINNKAFHLGDVVEGMKIVSIDPTCVKLQRDSQVLELRISV